MEFSGLTNKPSGRWTGNRKSIWSGLGGTKVISKNQVHASLRPACAWFKKEPVTVEMLVAIVADAQQSGSLSDLQLAKACLLAFASFLWFG